MNSKLLTLVVLGIAQAGCGVIFAPNTPEYPMHPAEEFSRRVKEANLVPLGESHMEVPSIMRAKLESPVIQVANKQSENSGGSVEPNLMNPELQPSHSPSIPLGSQAPYYNGQMTANPSLWPDESTGSELFRDFRAFKPMDVITINVDEKSTGAKKATTDTEGKYDLVAGISNFLGLETKSWAKNNTGLDPTSLLKATTDNKFEGDGETKRSGSLLAKISAVIMEVLPNGLMRIEGTKIISLNSEEETMVISGLVRERDINANNEVDSSRIADMRIDFYGKGVVGEQQSPGWAARFITKIWPF